MNVRAIAITSSVSIVLLAVLPSALDFSFAGASTISRQTQKTAIHLSAVELKKPLMLRIGSAQLLTRATGEIRVNGQLLKKLNRSTTQIDLAPKLKLGKNTVAVSGQYSPANAAIDIELVSPNSHVSQKTAGSGTINQILAIEIQ
jgi:hypothetical protein